MRLLVVVAVLAACDQTPQLAEHGQPELAPACTCQYGPTDSAAKILEDNCPTAPVCEKATCTVEITRDGTKSKEVLPCESPPPPPPPAEPASCTKDTDCPIGHRCHRGLCRKECQTHADCTAPDKCFMVPGDVKLCLHEVEYRCGMSVDTKCVGYFDLGFETSDGKHPNAGITCVTDPRIEFHENHGANNYYCGELHDVLVCELNATKTDCGFVERKRKCYGLYWE